MTDFKTALIPHLQPILTLSDPRLTAEMAQADLWGCCATQNTLHIIYVDQFNPI